MKQVTLVVGILFLALPVIAAPEWTLDGLRLGMTHHEVVEALGRPDWEDQTVDDNADPYSVLRYFREHVSVPGAPARKSESYVQVTLDNEGRVKDVDGVTLQRDGQVVVRLGDLRRDVLAGLGPPQRHEPESGSRIGDDTYPQVRVRYSGGRVFELAFPGEYRAPGDLTPEQRALQKALSGYWELEPEEAARRLKHAMEIAQAIDPDGREVADVWYAMASAPHGNLFVTSDESKERNRRRAECYEKALAIYRRVLHDRHGRIVNVLENLAHAYAAFDPERALRTWQEAREVEERRDPDSPGMAYLLSWMVEHLRSMGRQEDADRLAAEARPIWDKHGLSEERPFGYGSTSFAMSATGTVAARAPLEAVGAPDYPALVRHPVLLPVQDPTDYYPAVLALLRSRPLPWPGDVVLLAGGRAEVGRALEAAGTDADGLEAMANLDSLAADARRLHPEVDPRLLTWAATRGLLQAAWEPPLQLVREPGQPTPQQLEAYSALASQVEVRAVPAGELGGLGYVVEEHPEGGVVLVEPVGDPLDGLSNGDRIVAMDGVDLTTLPYLEALGRIPGPVGSWIEVTVLRDQPIRVRVQRREIRYHEEPRVLPGGVMCLRIRRGIDLNFPTLAPIAALDGGGELRGLVLDLRGTRGGMGGDTGYWTSDPRTPLELAGQWVAALRRPGLVVARRADTGTDVRSSGDSLDLRAACVVLVDERTEGLAVVLAAALRASGVPVVGEPTAGGVLLWDDLPVTGFPGLYVRLPATAVLDPTGRDLSKSGLEPDVRVEMDRFGIGDPERDIQMKRALQILGLRPEAGTPVGPCGR